MINQGSGVCDRALGRVLLLAFLSAPVGAQAAPVVAVCSPSGVAPPGTFGGHAVPSRVASDSLHFGPFGTVHLYGPRQAPDHVVLFVSGDGGWNLGVVDMAREIAALHALVVGIDIRHYLATLAVERGPCAYPAQDFEALSQYVQQQLGFDRYLPPVLIGYSSGATLVYAVLAQAPPGTFRGAVSLGFCPDLEFGQSFCRGSGLVTRQARTPSGTRKLVFEPMRERSLAWIALQGTIDQVCAADSTRAFVEQVKGGTVVMLPGVGHGFSVARNWLPQLKDAFARLATESAEAAVSAPSVSDLPLVEVPAHGPAHDFLALVLSGDGGWAGIDREIGAVLADSGVPVVGLNSLQYFWHRRTPDETAGAVARVLRHYLAAWHKKEAILVGYSRGADVLPFVANRLPHDVAARVPLVALIAPGQRADFEFHTADLVFDTRHAGDLPLAPELARLMRTRLMCFYGSDEADSGCRLPLPKEAAVVELSGGHHLGGQYAEIGAAILRAINKSGAGG